MPNHFAALLRKIRQDAGFRTAYAFYNVNGGQRLFPFTYAYYAKIEGGKSLPRAAWLPLLFSTLTVSLGSGRRRDLTVAYLRDSFGEDALFDDMVAPYLAAPKPAPLQGKVIRRLIGGLAQQVTLEQFDIILSSPAAFWSFFCLSMSRAPLSLEDLVQISSCRVPQAKTALKKLCAHKLLKRAPDGRYSSLLRDKIMVMPTQSVQGGERQATFARYVDLEVKRRGGEMMSRRWLLRAEEADMLDLADTLRSAVDLSAGCAAEDRGDRTGMYFVETRLRRVLQF